MEHQEEPPPAQPPAPVIPGAPSSAATRPPMNRQQRRRARSDKKRRRARSDKKRPWARSDQINRASAVIAGVALFLSSVPYIRGIIHHFTAPSATISHVKVSYTSIKAGCETDVDANVSASNIAPGNSLWLVARDFRGLWYPTVRIEPSRPGAQYGSSSTPDPVSEYDVIMLSNSNDGSFVRYESNPKSQEQGFYSLPPGYRVLKTWEHQVSPVDPSCSGAGE
jgi:hypothetical protein